MLVIDNFVNPLPCGATFFLTTYTTIAVTTAAANSTKTLTETDTPAITATPGPWCPPNVESALALVFVVVCSR